MNGSLKKLYNTRGITDVGMFALFGTSITDIDLESTTSIGQTAFGSSRKLKRIKGGSNVKSIGTTAFMYTPELKNIDTILDGIKEKGSSATLADGAMYLSSIKYDWTQLTDSVADGTYPTPYQWNSNSYDYWITKQQGTFKETINDTPTKMWQSNPIFKDEIIGAKIGAPQKNNKKYSAACALLSLMHSYCGIRNYTFETPMEVEEQMLVDATKLGKSEDLKNAFTNYAGNVDKLQEIANCLGLSNETVKYGENGITTYEQLVNKFYDELQKPDTYYYIPLCQGGSDGITGSSNHGECCIGLKANGDILMLHSADRTLTPFEIPPQNFYLDRRTFLIIREGDNKVS
jgi:hypothetical protein